VYAIGDVTGIPLKMGKPLPKAGVFAELEAKVVAHNIILDITGGGETESFSSRGVEGTSVRRRSGFVRRQWAARPVPASLCAPHIYRNI